MCSFGTIGISYSAKFGVTLPPSYLSRLHGAAQYIDAGDFLRSATDRRHFQSRNTNAVYDIKITVWRFELRWPWCGWCCNYPFCCETHDRYCLRCAMVPLVLLQQLNGLTTGEYCGSISDNCDVHTNAWSLHLDSRYTEEDRLRKHGDRDNRHVSAHGAIDPRSWLWNERKAKPLVTSLSGGYSATETYCFS